MEQYELIYKIEKEKSHIRLLGEEFFNNNVYKRLFYLQKNKI